MKNFVLAGFTATIVINLSNTLFLYERDSLDAAIEPNTKSYSKPISKKILHQKKSNTITPNASRKTSPISQSIKNQINHYTVEVLVGSPGQRIRLQVDSGSSDTWMNWVGSSFCQQAENDCAKYGAFDFEASTTKQFVLDKNQNPQQFFVSYQDNAQAKGKFLKDKFMIGGKSVKDVQFGLATETNVKIPSMGLGLPDNEVVVLLGQGNEYPNFVSTLFDDGLIRSRSYSLWLNDLKSDSGIILFGGVDSAKFVGKLASFSIQTFGRYKEFGIILNNIALSNSSPQEKFSPVPAVLDSGSTYSFLPAAIVTAVWQALDAIHDSDGTPYVECEFTKSSITLDFTFGSKKIKVPMSQLVFRNPDVKPLISGSGVPLCTLGILSSKDKITLGLTFLRSVYVVYDIERREVSIAKAKYTSESSIHELDSGGVPKLYSSEIPGLEVADEDDSRLQIPGQVSASSFSSGIETNEIPEESPEPFYSSSSTQLEQPTTSDFDPDQLGDIKDDRSKGETIANDIDDEAIQ